VDTREFIDAFSAIAQYFGASAEPTEERIERFLKNLPLDRMLGAREDGQVVGGAGSYELEMTVPGGAAVPTAGISVVGVFPTHRRRGVLRAMMKAQLEDLHERGEPLAALWASVETIYGRFGYGIASLTGEISIAREFNAYASPHRPVGRVRFVGADEAPEVLSRIWDTVRAMTPGMLSRSPNWREYRILADPPDRRDGGGPKRIVVVEIGGRPCGYAIYRHNPKFEEAVSVAKLSALEVMAEDSPATADLWRYLLDVDWSATASAWLLPVDHPLWFLLATPRRMKFRVADGLWVRLIDVGAALSARTYAAGGALVLEVADESCPWNEGRWRLEGSEARRRDSAGVGVSRRLQVGGAGEGREGGGATPGRGSGGGRDVPNRPRAVVLGDLLGGYNPPDPGRLAQLGEHQLDKLGVTGSSPVPPIPVVKPTTCYDVDVVLRRRRDENLMATCDHGAPSLAACDAD
jgi:predicted acetyltransferase